MPKIYRHERAVHDLIEHYSYLTEKAGLATADRFLKNIEAEFADLALNPLMGSALKLRHPKLAGMRKWHVKGFTTVLIFYIPNTSGKSLKGISIIRVLHAAQDWWSVLGITP